MITKTSNPNMQAKQPKQQQTKQQLRNPRSPKTDIIISREIIEDAVKGDSSHCMIAEAIRDRYPNASAIAVDLQTIRFSDREKRLRYTYLTPRIVQLAIVRFDQGLDQDPFQFSLRGGQVTVMKEHIHRVAKFKPQPGEKPNSEEQKAVRIKETEVSRGIDLGPVRLANRNGSKSNRSSHIIPDRVGGKTPPIMKDSNNIPFSRRRQFGLRALDRSPVSIELLRDGTN